MSRSWDDVNRRLVGAILALDLDDILTIGDRRDDPPRRFLGRRQPPAPRRFVRVTAAQTVLVADCVGSPTIGGEWPMSPEEEAELLRQGWERPWRDTDTTFQRESALVGAPRLALALVRALRTLGADPDALDYELTRETTQ